MQGESGGSIEPNGREVGGADFQENAARSGFSQLADSFLEQRARNSPLLVRGVDGEVVQFGFIANSMEGCKAYDLGWARFSDLCDEDHPSGNAG
jgi:hypothetical protein